MSKVSKEASMLLAEADKHRKLPRKGWWNDLTEQQRQAIKQAYKSLPDNSLSIMGLVRAIIKKYKVNVKESAIRTVLRDLDNR